MNQGSKRRGRKPGPFGKYKVLGRTLEEWRREIAEEVLLELSEQWWRLMVKPIVDREVLEADRTNSQHSS